MYRMRLFACAENTSLLKIKLHKSKCVDILLHNILADQRSKNVHSFVTYICIFSKSKRIKQIARMISNSHQIYSWIAHHIEVGTSFRSHHNYVGPISNPRQVLDSSAQTTRNMLLDFFCKTSKQVLLASFHVFCSLFVFFNLASIF